MALIPKRMSVPMKGMNSVAPPRGMSHEFSPDLLNIWYDDGITLRRRLCAHTPVVATAPAGAIQRVLEYRVTSPILFTQTKTGAVYVKASAASPWAVNALAPTYTAPMRSAQLRSLMIVGDGVGIAKKYNGTTWSAVTTPPPTIGSNKIGSIFHVHRGRCYAAGDPAFPMTILFSDAMTSSGVDYWSPTASATGQKGGFIDISADLTTGDVITGLTTHRNYFVVFCKNHTLFYQITDPIAASPYLYKVVKGEGCISQDSIQPIGEDTIFLSPNGFKKLSVSMIQGDSQVNDLSQPVNNIIKQALRDPLFDPTAITSTYNPKYGLYLIVLGTAVWVYQTQFEGWFRWDGLSGAVVHTDSNLVTTVAKGDSLHTFDNTKFADEWAVGVQTPVRMLWATPPARSEVLESKPRWNRVELVYETNLLTDSVDISTYLDLDILTTTKATKVLQADMLLPNTLRAGRVDLPITGRSELITIICEHTGVSDFRMKLLEVYYTETGVR